MSSSLRAIVLLSLAAVGLSLASCQKSPSEDGKKASPQPATQASTQPTSAQADAANQARFDRQAFDQDFAALTATPHRLAGYEDGSLRASQYVQTRLRQMGIPDQDIFVQTFPVMQAVSTEAKLIAKGKTFPVYPLRPNILQASITPAEGLEGQTVYVGKGTPAEYGRVNPQDKIVVMDFDCDINWLDAFSFGARAVIFVGDGSADRAIHHVNVPANLPRFYVTPDVARELGLTGESQTVKLLAASEWRQFRGRNVITVLRGTAPTFSKDRHNQAIVLAAPLDSYGEVPLLATGARDAANVAALLQMTGYLKENRPRRDVIVCFFDGDTLSHAGARAFYGAIYRKMGNREFADYPLDDDKDGNARLQNFTAEKEYLQAVLARLGQENIFAEGPYLEQTKRLLRTEAQIFGTEVLNELRPLRIELAQIRSDLSRLTRENAPSAQTAQQIQDLTAQEAQTAKRVETLEIEDLTWNSIERVVFEEGDLKDPAYMEKVFGKFQDQDPAKTAAKQARMKELAPIRLGQLLDHTRKVYTQRIQEIDQALAEVEQAKRLLAAFGPADQTVMLHLTVNLGDARNRWTFVHGEDSIPLGDDNSGGYRSLFKAIEKIYKAEAQAFDNFESQALRDRESRLFAPGKFADSAGVARLFGISNMALMTSLDRRVRQGLPIDRPEKTDTATLFAQAQTAAPFVKLLGDSTGLDVSSRIHPNAGFAEGRMTSPGKFAGPSVKRAGAGSALADQPVRDAVVALVRFNVTAWQAWPIESAPPGYELPIIVKTNANGIYEAGPYLNVNPGLQRPVVFAATFDKPPLRLDQPESRYRSRGLITEVTNEKTIYPVEKIVHSAIILFKTRFNTVVGFGHDRTGIKSMALRALSSAQFRTDMSLVAEQGNILTIFAPYDSKGYKVVNKAGMFILNNQPGVDTYQGQGVSLSDPFHHPITSMYTAHDLQVLNEYRLRMLRDNRINQESLEVLNGVAKDLREDALAMQRQTQAATAPAAGVPANITEKVICDLEASAAYSRRTYIPLIGVMNDLVTAVVLLLLLAMPFAFAMERLLVGTPHIYRQIAWFAIFFLLTFGLLYLVNPAFRIAATPIIIFLAFTIILLSSLVIFIMVRKLQTEIKKMQGLASTVHSADVSRLSTMMAAVSMGISTMRRRPVRTLLTAATVVLLTFTILTFASFGSEWGIRNTYQGPLNGNKRILVRHQLWSPIESGLLDVLRGHLSDRALAVGRYWISPTSAMAKEQQTTDMLVATDKSPEVLDVSAAIGVDIEDIKRLEGLADLFDGDTSLLASDGLYLTEAVAAKLGLTRQDVGKTKVLLAGKVLTYGGSVKDSLSAMPMLEGSSMLPVDYQASAGGQIQEQSANVSEARSEMPDVESAQFVRFNLDRVVIVPAHIARQAGGKLRSITIYPNDLDKIAQIGQDVATISELPTYLGDQGRVHRLLFSSLTQASGWRDLMIPVLLGGLIIFATMLGSVSDREREIYTFSSLGLAPPHVASLFFAEASVYAVVGGMGGYLLGQLVARLLGWLSSMGLVSVPPMNYSSTNAIVTVLIVMGTVLISTIYPALKASRSANPGIQRAWRIPKPQGSLFDLKFPFTVSAYDIVGVVSFLKEHFDSYSDTSLGIFTSMSSRIFRQEGSDLLGFRAHVALAPFDLGVTQHFAMLSQPSEIPGIDEVRILIARDSGAHGDWQRANRVFVNDLRKQLLIWRSLPHDVMDKYRQKTLEQWQSLPIEKVDGASMGGSL